MSTESRILFFEDKNAWEAWGWESTVPGITEHDAMVNTLEQLKKENSELKEEIALLKSICGITLPEETDFEDPEPLV
jgi:hypothetical protein